jgi:hypothetical protein
MTFVEMISDPRCRDLLICATAAEFVHGTVGLDGRAGWARPERFLPEQLRALGSCVAWHPGLYKQMARTAAGVCVEFDTDSSEVALELRTPGLSASARSLVDPTLLAQPSFDGVACEIVESNSQYEYYRDIYIDIEEEGKTVSIVLRYLIDYTKDDGRLIPSETAPARVLMFGEQNGAPFVVSLYEFTQTPTYEWLSSFGLTPYVPSADSDLPTE